MRQRGRDEGGSEGRPVMGRIEGESSTERGRPRRSCRPTYHWRTIPVMGRIEGESSTERGRPRRSCRPTYHWRTISPHRESGLTSLRSSVTREPRRTDSGRQAEMSAAEMLAGAAPGRAAARSVGTRRVS
jgi:hypothetical protein